MIDEDVYELAKEIDDLNDRVQQVVARIKSGGHPKATAIAEALDEQCVILASARMVIDNVVYDDAPNGAA